MNDLFEKFREDARFSSLVKLGMYLILIVVVLLLVLLSPENSIKEFFKEDTDEVEKLKINLPEEYTYKYTVKKNNEEVIYEGTYTLEENLITKKYNNEEVNYRIVGNDYYIVNGDNLTKTSISDVYNIISNSYLKIENINKYIGLTQKLEDKYIVYVKDINVLEDNDDFITFNFTDNGVEIDYTSLIKLEDENVENCTVYFEYSGKE